ncbi:hypothetical protein J7T55_010334 [Diaporthe amygdali]|uniref:uncharacterized protein n=1 Tax=Phomopsis amygdali TaxID=1214568 RepID=UPI0022FE9D42|nr:uncharacterized protein J7T55_010334 [Diaporthe amygdali]KAJ0107727.1 hypothetical protein J7T55_010334 [Diaporthe amygdali]
MVLKVLTTGSIAGPVPSHYDASTTKGAEPTGQYEGANNKAPARVSGEAHKRFVVVTTLLSLIDPKKFLDSFALISSTSRTGGDTASAVCLEQGHPSGTILRLARNRGIPEKLVNQLQEVLDDLTTIALGEKTARDLEYGILRKVIILTEDKIWSVLEKLHHPEVLDTIQCATDRMLEKISASNDAEEMTFKQWVSNLPLLVSLDLSSDPDELIPHIKWASQARWVYSEELENFFGCEDGELPLWLKHIYKIGRYYAATKAMLKLARKQPAVFTRIHVEPVDAPEPEKFSLGNERTPLLTVLKKITKADPEKLKEKLGKTWFTDDPETRLRRACRMTLTVHAEMQLLSFYDHRPHLTPRLVFMGTSKKACYLCHEFMSRHPLTIGVSATHQKLYPTWMPAPCSSAVRKKHKVLLWEFSRHLEQTTARDLETRLGIQRPATMDSTAGPSLTTTGTVSTDFWFQNLSLVARDGSENAAFEESDKE